MSRVTQVLSPHIITPKIYDKTMPGNRMVRKEVYIFIRTLLLVDLDICCIIEHLLGLRAVQTTQFRGFKNYFNDSCSK